MTAIFKRDFASYFNSPIGYAFLTVFTLFTGFFFILNNALGLSADLTPVFSNAVMVFIFIVPLLTVKMLTEERKAKTDQILLTSPVKVTSIVLGKYFAALAVLLVALLITGIYVLILLAFGKPSFGELFTSYIGFFLIGAAFISIGLYLSSLTDNQFVGAVISFAVIMLLYLLSNLLQFIPSEFLKSILSWFAITDKYADFARGILSVDSILYYLSICALFNVLTVFSIEKRRWR